MTIKLANRIKNLKPSATFAVAARAAQLKAQGLDIISLSVGEPDFDTPDFVKQAAVKAIDSGFTKYTAVNGIPELRQAIVNKLHTENQLDYKLNQIIVSNGAKQSIYNLFEALLNPGDEVIIPAPYWVSYPEMAILAEATPKIIAADYSQNFKITAEQLQAAITSKSRLLILNSPSNPTGMVYSKAELSALAEVLLAAPQVLVLSDDIYEYILWSKEPFANIVDACSDLYERTIVVNGVSKSHAMTGWRIGYAAGPAELIHGMEIIQSQSTSNPNSIAQKAATVAIEKGKPAVAQQSQIFAERCQFVYEHINKIRGFELLPAEGAFYAFPRVQACMDQLGLATDVEFAEYLLDHAHVAVVPGSAFGSPGYIRLSYATDIATLKTAINRIAQALQVNVKL